MGFFLANVVTNNQVPLIGDYVRIVASLINAFRPPLYEKYPTDPTVAKRVLEKSKVEHPLTCLFFKDNERRTAVKMCKMDAAEAFPVLTEENLRSLTFGVYQLKQALS